MCRRDVVPPEKRLAIRISLASSSRKCLWGDMCTTNHETTKEPFGRTPETRYRKQVVSRSAPGPAQTSGELRELRTSSPNLSSGEGGGVLTLRGVLTLENPQSTSKKIRAPSARKKMLSIFTSLLDVLADFRGKFLYFEKMPILRIGWGRGGGS